MTKKRFPLSYRTTETEKIFSKIRSGDSCLLIGIGSVGKSNLLRFLQQEDLLRKKLGNDRDKFLFIYIDINKILEESAWGLYELILHQILVEISGFTVDSTKETIDDLHKRSTAPTTQHLALR